MNELPREWAHHGDKAHKRERVTRATLSSPATLARPGAGMAARSQGRVGMTPDRKWKFEGGLIGGRATVVVMIRWGSHRDTDTVP